MLEIKLFSSFLVGWRMSAVPISGAKVDIIPYSFISWRSFDFRQCSKVFSGVSICSNPFRFVQKRCFFSKNFFVSHTTSVLPCDLGVFTIIGLASQHTQFYFYTSFLSPCVSISEESPMPPRIGFSFFAPLLAFLTSSPPRSALPLAARHPAGWRLLL